MRNDADIIEAKDNSTEEQRYLCSIPGMMEKILQGMAEPLSEAIPESEVEW